jgi:hypothetical protein
MAWVLVTGEDTRFLQNSFQILRPAGYEVLAVPDGGTALQLLVDVTPVRDMVVLLRPRMGQTDVADFLSAVAADDARLRWSHAYILLDGRPGGLPAEVERFRAQLAVPMVPTPMDADDVDGWADLLDAIHLAVQLLPSHRPLSHDTTAAP